MCWDGRLQFSMAGLRMLPAAGFRKQHRLWWQMHCTPCAGLSLDDRTAVLLMTHNYQYDLALLEQLMDSKVAYIGILGPKSKTKRLIGDLPPEKQLPAFTRKSVRTGRIGSGCGNLRRNSPVNPVGSKGSACRKGRKSPAPEEHPDP